jgi:serine/threonine-protein kinase HipA
MKYCPITYEAISAHETYSKAGLHLLSPQLHQLQPLAFSAAEQRAEAIAHAGKMSIQGVQAKLSAVLKIKEAHFQIVDQKGAYILKPQSEHYPELPENEAVTMSLAETIGIDVPVHGLVYSKDDSMTYFIRRFDRIGRKGKVAVEDFSQLSQQSRDTKYDSSMEKVAAVLQQYCSFHKIEAIKLFKLVVFNFLVGNEDMHLKNFSLLSAKGKTLLAPAYDLLNTTIAQRNTKEELALPLNGKKNNLKRSDIVDYYGAQKLQLNEKIIVGVLSEIQRALPIWQALIQKSFLSKPMQDKYLELLAERVKRLEIK